MKTRKYYSAILLLMLVLSCEEKTDWEIKADENGALVVEAIITDEFKTQEIILSLSYDDLNGDPVFVTGAEVSLTDGLETFLFEADLTQPGRYLSEQVFSAQLNVPYTLEIEWNGETYTAVNEMIEVYPFNIMTFRAANRTELLTIGEVAPIYSPFEQAMYEVNIDWSHLVASDTAQAKLFFYSFNTIDVNELFRPPKEVVVFPKGSIVIEKKHSLNPEFAAYFRALLMETEWQGGIFDEASASLPSNISNGGLGFFGVSAVLSDTLVAE